MEPNQTRIAESIINSFQNEKGEYSIFFSLHDAPIFKATLSGYAKIEDARETERVLDESYEYLKNKFNFEKLFFLVDMENFKGTSWKAKMHFQNIARNFFSEKRLGQITLLKPTKVIENMLYLAQKINPDFQISVCNTEKEGIEQLRKAINNPSFEVVSQALPDEDYLIRNSIKLPVVNENEWNLEFSGDHSVQFYLIDGRIVLYKESGTSTNVQDVQKIIQTLKSVIDHSEYNELFLITDFSNLQFVSLKVRKEMAKKMRPLRPYWNFKYHIFKKLIKVMYYVYMQLDTSVKQNSLMVKDWQTAIDHYLKRHYKDDPQKKVVNDIPLEDYSSLTRQELISMLLQKEKDLSNMTYHQNEKIQELFYAISKISWDDAFEPSELREVIKDDPFAPLSNAIQLLERDIFEIVSDLKNFNDSLETKVLERTSELRSQNEELVKVNTELDSFVYKTSHDLRAPLVSVMGLVNIAKLEKDPDQKIIYLEMIEKSMYKLDGFIRDIIDFSRNARFPIEYTDIDFSVMINSIWEDLDIVQMSSIEKRVNIGNSIPFSSDIIRIKMILSNLISNAIRYHKDDRKSPFVAVDINIDEVGAEIRVEDNGQGISSIFIPHIFDMFFRASESSMGSGLGLYIVKEAVTKLNGNIKVDSKVNKGSCFIIHLPHANSQ